LAAGLALILVFAGVGVHSNPVYSATQAAASASPDPDAATGAVVLQACGGCHSVSTLTQHPQDAAGWTQTVATMEQMGAQVPPTQRAAVIAYLARHFGPR
jgi:cytochrome c2